jgi:hypothetical protein
MSPFSTLVATRGRLVALVLALYLAACALPAIHLPGEGAGEFRIPTEDAIGLKALLFGWGYLSFNLAWLANPLLLVGLICYGRRRDTAALILGVAASLAALTTWSLPGRSFGPPLIGYYLWQASCLALTCGSFRALWAVKVPSKSPEVETGWCLNAVEPPAS